MVPTKRNKLMSFFDDASLAFLPSGAAGKDGKAYSIKPTDGTGDFTFSRGSNLSATRVGADGLIEKGRENLLKQSNAFTSSPWNDGGDYTITNGQDGYDGTSDAWLLQKNTTGNDYLLQSSLSADAVNTFSFYAKEGSVRGVKVVCGGQNVAIDLRDGSTISTGGASALIVAGADLVSGTTDWYRVYLTRSVATTSVLIKPTDENGADASGSIYLQDTQLENGLAATDYIESGASTGKAGLLEDEPRFDYSGGATCPSLLLEPSRTNLVVQSEYLNGIGWNAFINSSIDTNATTSPEGLINASLLKENLVNDTHAVIDDFSLTSGSTYTISIFAKSNGVNRNLRLADGGVGWGSGFTGKFDLTAGTATGGDIESMGNGWYRCSVTGTTNATTSRLIIYSTLGTTTSYQGDGTSGVFLYGLQVEAGSYPTSYIPNHSGGTITRGQDSASVLGLAQSFPLTAYIEIDVLSISDYNQFQFRQDVSNFVLRVGNQIRVGATYVSNNTLGSNKFALSVDASGNFELFRNGTSLSTGTITGSIDEIRSDAAGYEVKQILLFPTALTDSECIELTTI